MLQKLHTLIVETCPGRFNLPIIQAVVSFSKKTLGKTLLAKLYD